VEVVAWGGGIPILRLFTEALGAFLAARLSALPDKPVVSFAFPGAVRGRNALNIFLCALAEDAERRSNEKEYSLVESEWISKPAALRVKCTYVASVWPDGGDAEEAALSQLRILGKAYSVLVSTSAFPKEYLPEPFKAADLPRPAIAIVSNDLSSRPEFWESAGSAFRPSFSFCAKVSLPADEEHYDHVVEGLDIKYVNGLLK
jgi:hypothetical protein